MQFAPVFKIVISDVPPALAAPQMRPLPFRGTQSSMGRTCVAARVAAAVNTSLAYAGQISFFALDLRDQLLRS
jgi:hypothetical protein